jgi:gliding motility-associated-like protein
LHIRSIPVFFILICLHLGDKSPLFAQQFCNGTLSSNALSWGDFGSGPPSIVQDNPNIAPGYQYDPVGPPGDGFYTIATNTRFDGNAFPCWLNIKDDSDDPDGYMMIVNATQDPGVFLETTVRVCPDTDYTFVVSVHNLNRATCTGTTLPEIDFLINGVVIYQTGPIERSERWERYSVSFTTNAGENELILQLRNNSPGGAGSDFAIDNIGFYHCGPEIKLNQTEIPCEGGKTVIEAIITENIYDNPVFEWQLSDNNGISWISLERSANAQVTLSGARSNQLVRAKAAASLDNLDQELCHVITESSQITTIPSEIKDTTYTICDGSFIVFQDSILSEEGLYLFEEADSDGCIVVISVKVSVLFSSIDTIMIDRFCTGDTFLGILLVGDTSVVETSKNQLGCDSITVYQLLVREATEIELAFDEWICPGETSMVTITSPHLQVIWEDGTITSNRSIDPGIYTISVLDNQRCVQDTLIQVYRYFEGFNWEIDPIGCNEGEVGNILLRFEQIPLDGYRFILNGQPQIIRNNFDINDLNAGTYTLALQSLDNNCSIDTLFELFEPILNFPDWYFVFSNPLMISQPIEVGIVSPHTLSSILWTGDGILSCNDCETLSWRPSEPGRLFLTMVDANGCEFSRDTAIDLSTSRTRIFIPNAFTPNGDNINDQFELLTNQPQTMIESFEIFDRWGGLVYVSNDQNGLPPKWDGTINGRQADPGIYIYLIKVIQIDGQERRYRGTVQLMR